MKLKFKVFLGFWRFVKKSLMYLKGQCDLFFSKVETVHLFKLFQDWENADVPASLWGTGLIYS